MANPLPPLYNQLNPKNGDRRFDWQRFLTPKETNDIKRSIKRVIYDDNKDDTGYVNCCYCNNKIDLEHMTLEHKFPQCFGGSYIKSNLAPCCNSCNNDRSINFTADGKIINVGLFKCPPLKTTIMQEKLSALIVVRLYSLIRNKNIENVPMDEALSYFYDGIVSNDDMLNKLPKGYRDFLNSSAYNPWYKKLYNKIKKIFKKKEVVVPNENYPL